MSAIVLRGDAAHLPLPDSSVDLIVTSPPYFGLRSYTDAGEHYEGQIGSEETPQAYLEALWECTREWVRVLKPGGSIFVNLGDKFSDRGHGPNRGNGTGRGPQATHLPQTRGPLEKSLLLLPERYRIGCMDRLGLIVRETIVWHKLNGLPESVQDRCRRAHEDIVHLVRQPRYFSAVDEIREPHLFPGKSRTSAKAAASWAHVSDQKQTGLGQGCEHPLGKLPGSVWEIPSAPLVVPAHLGVDHFAAYPPELVRRIILGWSPAGVCTGCGEGRRPVAQREVVPLRSNDRPGRAGLNQDGAHGTDRRAGTHKLSRSTITGYACACTQPDEPAHAAVVVDPFGGTGTTALVASVLGRTGITVDRSADYCRLAQWRTSDPGERARALGVPKPPPVTDGQGSLFDGLEAS